MAPKSANAMSTKTWKSSDWMNFENKSNARESVSRSASIFVEEEDAFADDRKREEEKSDDDDDDDDDALEKDPIFFFLCLCLCLCVSV